MPGELELTLILCAGLFGGQPEVRVPDEIAAGRHHVRVDCLTDEHAIEVGLDRRSSYDSVHQALVAAALTGRAPKVVMIDTDGVEDATEFQVKAAARASSVRLVVLDVDYLLRWRMTAPFRERRASLQSALR